MMILIVVVDRDASPVLSLAPLAPPMAGDLQIVQGWTSAESGAKTLTMVFLLLLLLLLSLLLLLFLWLLWLWWLWWLWLFLWLLLWLLLLLLLWLWLWWLLLLLLLLLWLWLLLLLLLLCRLGLIKTSSRPDIPVGLPTLWPTQQIESIGYCQCIGIESFMVFFFHDDCRSKDGILGCFVDNPYCAIHWLARTSWFQYIYIYDYMYVWNYSQHIIWSISHPLAVHTTHINTARTNPTHMGAFENGVYPLKNVPATMINHDQPRNKPLDLGWG